jgi:hypothetical protein
MFLKVWSLPFWKMVLKYLNTYPSFSRVGIVSDFSSSCSCFCCFSVCCLELLHLFFLFPVFVEALVYVSVIFIFAAWIRLVFVQSNAEKYLA